MSDDEKQEDSNVILLDWAKGAQGPSYRLSAANTQLVGKQLELILLDMISLGTSPSQIHIIGFSLGAHIAGYAGRSLSQRGIKLGRITGLDPASPLFRESFTSLPALSKEDAAFVDVIHTDGSILLTEGFGLLRALGHVDFFPNGGQDQPGCEYVFASVLVSHLEGTVNSSTICNHARGFQLFMESVTSKQDGCQFRSFPCISREHFRSGACFPSKCEINSTDGSCGIMGYNADLGLARGPLYMVTREERPFCGDQLQSIVVLSKNGLKPRSNILLSAKVEDDTTSFELRNEPRDPFQGYVYRGLSASMYGLYNSQLSNVTVTLVLRYAPRMIGEIIVAEYVRIANLDGDFIKKKDVALSVVVCGDRVRETLVLIKSAIVFSRKCNLKVIIVAEPELIESFEETLSEWVAKNNSFSFETHPISFPKTQAEEWKKLFKPCASQRLFLPSVLKNVDSVLYVDTDVLFLSPVDEIWEHFDRMNSTQLAALSPEHEDRNTGWYNRFARHPYYGELGEIIIL
ncbi:unnamed protein product [Nezara viridula]|uniref:Lipase domain-containing protein n=1 Tax=Nezara viridula TaxID=85310 RepID=A0A9P0MLB5_NEZVI|nr:unnamed protein product [Nezara viridula]